MSEKRSYFPLDESPLLNGLRCHFISVQSALQKGGRRIRRRREIIKLLGDNRKLFCGLLSTHPYYMGRGGFSSRGANNPQPHFASQLKQCCTLICPHISHSRAPPKREINSFPSWGLKGLVRFNARRFGCFNDSFQRPRGQVETVC